MKRYPYFSHDDGLAFHTSDIQRQIEVIAGRYIGDNPPLPYVARVMSGDFFRQNDGGAYVLDLAEKLGTGADGYALIAGVLHSAIPKTVGFGITCLGPTSVWLNGEPLFTSTFNDEVLVGCNHALPAELKEGANTLLFLCRRTVVGFGCVFSFPHITVCPPFIGRAGMAGWVWTACLPDIAPETVQGVLALLQEGPANEGAKDLQWYPSLSQGEAAQTTQMALFPSQPGYCVAWSRIGETCGKAVTLRIHSFGHNDVYCNGDCLGTYGEGEYALSLAVQRPMDIHVVSHAAANAPAFGANLTVENGAFTQPVPCFGTDDPWLYAGWFTEEVSFACADFTSLTAADWRVRGKDLHVRLFYEGAYSDIWWVRQGGTAYGSWNYPIGVTLQGLLRTGAALHSEDITAYAQSHMRQCLEHYDYALRDRDRYGFPSLNPYLVRQSSLDDFGSMASAMLECYRLCPSKEAATLAGGFFAFIRDKLPKMPNGAFYRKANNPRTDTMWADDLYMGTSFLSRYYALFHEEEALELAITQFLAYKEYLFLPEHNIFCHVYDVSRKTATGIPWGRGNGWTLFSLADLLSIVPENHPRREALLALFRTLSEGYAALQDERGFWHQVLTDHSSYEEASCTAMFTYAISKGLRMAWYEAPQALYPVVHKGWQAIASYAVDKAGNVHAVCKGSGFSFTKEYYADELFWITNDNHGVGIVLLAGCEYLKLLEE